MIGKIKASNLQHHRALEQNTSTIRADLKKNAFSYGKTIHQAPLSKILKTISATGDIFSTPVTQDQHMATFPWLEDNIFMHDHDIDDLRAMVEQVTAQE